MNKSIKTEIIINASKEKVWQILTDFKSYPSWNPFLISIEGELKKGGRLTNVMQSGNKRFTFKPKVLSVVLYQYFDWLGSLIIPGLFDGHHYFELEELTPNQIKLNHGEHFSGLLSNAILKRVGEQTRQNFINMNGAVKTMAEAN